MRVFNTNKRHRLYRMGFPVAISFSFDDDERIKAATEWLGQLYGAEPWHTAKKQYHPWTTILGRWSRKSGCKTYFGLKDPKIVSALLLAVS
jgi:hypothetical protein